MIKYNMNPKGHKACDCVVRAIAYSLNQSWEDTYNDLCALGLKMKRMPNEKQVYEKYLEQKGWVKHKQPRAKDYEDGFKTAMKKYTVKEFIELMNFENKCLGKGKIIISVANHLTCIECSLWEYELVDTWDCSYKCVGNYWTEGA